MTLLSKAIDGIPLVADATERDVLFPSPVPNQRVWRTDTDTVERYNGAWIVAMVGGSRDRFHVEDYGAVGGDVGDQTAAINAAATAAVAVDGILTGSPGATYRCAGALNWEDLKYCDFTGVEIHSTITSGWGLTLGNATTSIQNAVLKLPALRSDQSGSLGVDGNALPEGSGIRILGLGMSQLYFQKVRNWEVGVRFEGGDGLAAFCAYNDIYSPHVEDCSEAQLLIQTSNADSFVNENRVFGGRLRTNSTYANETGSALIRMDDFGAGSNPNNWQFFGITLEGVILRTMDIIAAGFNTWWGCRWEGAADITFGTEAQANVIAGGQGVLELINNDVITDNGLAPGNGVVDPTVGRTVYPQLANLADSATPSVRGIHIAQANNNGTTITDFLDGVVGQEIIIVAASALTITQNASLIRLAGAVNFVMASQDVLHLVKTNAGAAWREVSRTTVV